MPEVQVTSKINIDLNEVLTGVAQLDTPDLEDFLSKVSLLLAQRKAPSLPKWEAELLQKINQGLPATVQQRYDDLASKLRAETITPAEHQELLALIDQIELADAERMQHFIELAQLRNMSVDQLMDQRSTPDESAGCR